MTTKMLQLVKTLSDSFYSPKEEMGCLCGENVVSLGNCYPFNYFQQGSTCFFISEIKATNYSCSPLLHFLLHTPLPFPIPVLSPLSSQIS